ncbi:glutathione S-transferase T3-like [Apium graveolens]|uniref:glutathione S-transferase T3-like n=1 Tax=Apium graveolens TaxID=4045 RepID=UPI003D7AC212
MERSFISLLNEEGSFSQFEEVIFSQEIPESQPQAEVPKQKKGKRSKNFLIEEDMLLISGWLNISMDPVQGSNQTHTSYWNRIWKYFEENKGGITSERTANSLCNRWCTINEKVAKFIGFYNQICGRNQSGSNEQDKVDQAIEMYERIMKEKFMFMRHWNSLRFSPKYQASLAKKNKPTKDRETSSPSVDSQHPTGLESDEMMERPVGRKAAKKLKRAINETKDEEGLELLKTMQKDALAIASSRSEAVQMSLQLQKEMMHLQKEELQLRLAKEERERQKEDRERQIYEASIMAMDTSKMLPDQAKYYDALKARIMRNI